MNDPKGPFQLCSSMMMMMMMMHQVVNPNYKNIDRYYVTDTSFNEKPKLSVKYQHSMYAVPNIVIFVALMV